MKFKIFGPYLVERRKNRIDKSSLPKFWEMVGEDMPNLPKACGCYLFATRAAGGFTPWYVGKADKRSFEDECFDYHKRDIYDEVIADRNGIPVLFLIVRLTGSKKKCSLPGKNGHREVDYVKVCL